MTMEGFCLMSIAFTPLTSGLEGSEWNEVSGRNGGLWKACLDMEVVETYP